MVRWYVVPFRFEDILVLLALVGIVSIITRSYIMEKIREKAPGKNLRYMLNCPQCSGFWVGLFFGLYFQLYIERVFAFSSFVNVLLWGGLVSLLSSIIIPLTDYLSFAKTLLVNKLTVIPSDNVSEDSDADEPVSDPAVEPVSDVEPVENITVEEKQEAVSDVDSEDK